MILIADSGSTKTDWIYFDKNVNSSIISTKGFNPLFHNETYILNELLKNNSLKSILEKVEKIFFFGAGCSSEGRKSIVQKALSSFFKNAEVNVEHDLLGAAIAACQGKSGIACILGTGSNACFFDGLKCVEKTPSLGYILGDEGSGSAIGKSLLKKYLYHQVPNYLIHKLLKKGFTKENILENVYQQTNVNTYLASVTQELADFKKEPWVIDFVGNHFEEFLTTHVLCFENSKNTSINFVGSIAFHFSEILDMSCKKLGLQLGNIHHKPIEALYLYYLKKTD